MTATVNFIAAQTAFAAAVSALESAVSVSPEKTARLEKILARIEKDSTLASRVLAFGAKPKGGLEHAVTVGAVVTFNYGRGDTARTLTGTVTAVRPGADKIAPAAKVRVGEGFEEELLSIHPAWVIAVEGAVAEEVQSEEDQLDLLESEVQA